MTAGLAPQAQPLEIQQRGPAPAVSPDQLGHHRPALDVIRVTISRRDFDAPSPVCRLLRHVIRGLEN
jgi:hypothetical protein